MNGNYVRTTLLLGLLTGLILICGQLLGGQTGLVLALVLAGGMNFFSYWFSDKIVLKMHRAREVGPEEAPELHAIVDRLVARADLPKPRLYVLPDGSPNAFATGRNPQHAAVAVTQGLLQSMSHEEVEGVVAHELAHVANRDILISSVAATIAGAITFLASMARWAAIFGGFGGRDDDDNILGLLFMAILAPIAAIVIQLAISRSREYSADATGARIAGNPYGLANALRKLGQLSQRVPMRDSTPAASHMYIVAPLAGRRGLASLFSTHPPIEERIRRLLGR